MYLAVYYYIDYLHVDSTDFEPVVGSVIFQPDQSVACGQVPIKDDDNPESSEVFIVTFVPVNLVISTPSDQMPVAEVTILDDDCK